MGSAYTIPNVGVMSSTGLTDVQVQNIIQALVMQCLGIDTTQDKLAYSRVRIDWPVPGQPAWLITDDVAFVRAVESAEAYNAAHEVQQSPNMGYGLEEPYGTGEYNGNDGDGSYTESTIYTRGWAISLIFYGPNAYDHARQVKACLYQDFTHDTLAASNLYVLPVTGTPSRIPELFANQWWPRTDFSFRMYEQVTDTLDKPTIVSVPLEIIDDDGDDIVLNVD